MRAFAARDARLALTVGLYVHVPFCARACPYCDFDFVVGRQPDVAMWRDALARECDARLGDARPRLRTIYLGGGTPSLLPAQALRDLLRWIDARFVTDDVVERTVELNPEHVDPDRIAALRDSGVDRVSLGLQSTATRGLVTLGRVHTPAAGLQAIAALARAGLHVSADLIVGWPDQTDADVRADIAAVIDAGAEHVSIYALTVEPDTPWAKLERTGRRAPIDPDRQADLMRTAETALVAAGLAHYEVASYARPGRQAVHNGAYWSWRDVIGIGPSAASVAYGQDGSVRRRTNRRGLAAWAADPATPADEEILPVARAAAEGLWLGLRRLDGFAVADFLARFAAVDRAWIEDRVRRPRAQGNVELTDADVLRIAPGRWLWHDDVAAHVLLPDDVRGVASGCRVSSGE